MKYEEARTKPRVIQQLTGLKIEEFDKLKGAFRRPPKKRNRERVRPAGRRCCGRMKTSCSSSCSLSGTTQRRKCWGSCSVSAKGKRTRGFIAGLRLSRRPWERKRNCPRERR